MPSENASCGPARKPIDLTLGEVAAMCGSANHEHPDLETIDFDGPPPLAVAAAFDEIHPAVAGSILRRIATGLDDGFTVQGAAHPHFQKPLRMALCTGESDGIDWSQDASLNRGDGS